MGKETLPCRDLPKALLGGSFTYQKKKSYKWLSRSDGVP